MQQRLNSMQVLSWCPLTKIILPLNFNLLWWFTILFHWTFSFSYNFKRRKDPGAWQTTCGYNFLVNNSEIYSNAVTFSPVGMKLVLILLQSPSLFLPIVDNGPSMHSFMLPKQRSPSVQASISYEKCPYLNRFQIVLYQFSTNKSK